MRGVSLEKWRRVVRAGTRKMTTRNGHEGHEGTKDTEEKEKRARRGDDESDGDADVD
jgi:hypothetical protein